MLIMGRMPHCTQRGDNTALRKAWVVLAIDRVVVVAALIVKTRLPKFTQIGRDRATANNTKKEIQECLH